MEAGISLVELICSECMENSWSQAEMKEHIYKTGHGVNFNDSLDDETPGILVFTPVRVARREWRRLIKAKQKERLEADAEEEED